MHVVEPGEAYHVSIVRAVGLIQLDPRDRLHQNVNDHALDYSTSEIMRVTVIDASEHCPGAVMFGFDGYFGRYLHTGDFRFTPALVCTESATICWMMCTSPTTPTGQRDQSMQSDLIGCTDRT
jgi:hypothetical protein